MPSAAEPARRERPTTCASAASQRPYALGNQALQGVAALVKFQAQPRHLVTAASTCHAS
jgi:hypothetical protein